MAIRDNDSLAYAAGTYTPSDRVYSFIWVYAAQTDASIRSFNIETNRIEKDTVTAKVNNGFKTVYLITTWYGKKLKVTSNHLVLTVWNSCGKLCV